MPIELKVPDVGESISEAEVGQWFVKQGQTIRKDDPVVELETDKASQELPAPVTGRLTEIVKQAGERVAIGDVIGYIEEGDDDDDASAEPASAGGSDAHEDDADDADEIADEEESPDARAEAGSDDTAGEQPDTDAPEGDPDQPPPAPPRDRDGRPTVMPAARRLLDEHGLDAGDIEATGPGGRLLKEDVQRHLDQSPEPASAGGRSHEPASDDEGPTSGGGGDREQLVPMTPLRRTIARRLVEAQQTAALLTTFNEIDMAAVMALRKQHQDAFVERYGIKLGFMSFFVKATIDALKQFPAVNAEVRGTDVLYKDYFNIGIAIGSGKGLVVPVLKDADRLGFAEVEQAIADFAKRAQAGKLDLKELQGGTFTITNGGVYGSLMSTPIVNPPQSGVLGMHAIQQRPVAVDGQVVVRPMMYVALTYDHRLVDGREAVSFLVRIKQAIEDPARMLIEA